VKPPRLQCDCVPGDNVFVGHLPTSDLRNAQSSLRPEHLFLRLSNLTVSEGRASVYHGLSKLTYTKSRSRHAQE